MNSWRSLQEWLGAEHRVNVPYTEQLAETIPPVTVRLRRDVGTLLNLVRTHGILHRANRQRDEQGCIIDTLEDYASARALVWQTWFQRDYSKFQCG